MQTVFKLNRSIVTNTSKYNLAEGLDLKIQCKFLCHKNNVCSQNLDENKKRHLISSTRTVDLLCQVGACMPIYTTYVLHFNLSTYVH